MPTLKNNKNFDHRNKPFLIVNVYDIYAQEKSPCSSPIPSSAENSFRGQRSPLSPRFPLVGHTYTHTKQYKYSRPHLLKMLDSYLNLVCTGMTWLGSGLDLLSKVCEHDLLLDFYLKPNLILSPFYKWGPRGVCTTCSNIVDIVVLMYKEPIRSHVVLVLRTTGCVCLGFSSWFQRSGRSCQTEEAGYGGKQQLWLPNPWLREDSR